MGKMKINYKVILSEGTQKGLIANIFYKLLIEKKKVSYEDIALDFLDYKTRTTDKNTYAKMADDLRNGQKISQLCFYQDIKKAVSGVVGLFKYYHLNITKHDKPKTCYSYLGGMKDPLSMFKLNAHIQDLVDQINKNIENRIPISILYKPFDKNERLITFHPHLVREYNKRFFAMGVAQIKGKDSVMHNHILALDRIVGEIKDASGVKYINATDDEYDYLKNIVGVTKVDGEPQPVKIRVYDMKAFGRITTKPLHYTQHTTKPFDNCEDDDKCHGEVELVVTPTPELKAQILGYGPCIEVIEPMSLRTEIAEDVRRLMENYGIGTCRQ